MGQGVCLTPNLLANEASSVIRVAGPLVNSHLRIWAQRACPVDLSCRLMGRNDLIRSFPALYPSCQGANAVEFVGARAALAVIHSGNHEQSNGVCRLRLASERIDHFLVVLNRIHGWDAGITPAMIHDQFSATIDERLQ